MERKIEGYILRPVYGKGEDGIPYDKMDYAKRLLMKAYGVSKGYVLSITHIEAVDTLDALYRARAANPERFPATPIADMNKFVENAIAFRGV